MFNLICRTLPNGRPAVRTSPTHNLFSFHYHPLSSSTFKSATNSSNQDSISVSYLINSCGFSPEKALSASKYTNFRTPDKPDSVIAFFKDNGFTETQISTLVRRFPRVLSCDPEKTLLPKLEFFRSLGVSSTYLTEIITIGPKILRRSLENRIIPSFNFFKNWLQSDEKTMAALRRCPMCFDYDIETYFVSNIKTLRESGVPESNIVALFTYKPRAFIINNESFRKIVEKVKKMGFNPLRMNFVLAIRALGSMSNITWEKKFELYKKWGWSTEATILAFVKYPWCMTLSEKKIMAIMDFYVNIMGWESSQIAQRPQLISFSFEKRIVPRCSVLQVLLSKGLIKKPINLASLLGSTESWFLQKFVTHYVEEAPQLLNLYQAKMDLSKK